MRPGQFISVHFFSPVHFELIPFVWLLCLLALGLVSTSEVLSEDGSCGDRHEVISSLLLNAHECCIRTLHTGYMRDKEPPVCTVSQLTS